MNQKQSSFSDSSSPEDVTNQHALEDVTDQHASEGVNPQNPQTVFPGGQAQPVFWQPYQAQTNTGQLLPGLPIVGQPIGGQPFQWIPNPWYFGTNPNASLPGVSQENTQPNSGPPAASGAGPTEGSGTFNAGVSSRKRANDSPHRNMQGEQKASPSTRGERRDLGPRTLDREKEQRGFEKETQEKTKRSGMDGVDRDLRSDGWRGADSIKESDGPFDWQTDGLG
ncbi:hypothetical protein NL676_035117 [Syzygium grande]|nr:hypothetical protein NL676_035117 [Syzygium grande]